MNLYLDGLFKSRLQLFADGDGAGQGGTDGGQNGSQGAGQSGADGGNGDGKGTEGGSSGKNEPEPKLKYTDADVDRIISEKFAKWQKQQDQKISEAQKLAEMNATQKAEYERDKLQKELDELRQKDTLSEMTATARKILSESLGGASVPDEVLSVIVSTDADQTKAAVDKLGALINDMVDKQVTAKLKGPAPKAGGSRGITKDEILKVADRKERQRLINEHMDLFQQKG